VLQDCFYTFEYRRNYAKLRRFGLFLNDSETIYKGIIRDELKHYQLCKPEDLPEDPRVDDKPLDYSKIDIPNEPC